MADSFYDDVPARANNIGTDVDQIELSLGWIKDVFQTICSWNDSSLTNICVGNRGLIPLRSTFVYKDTDEIYLNAGAYHHAGTTDQVVYWASQLTYQFGSGGSNSGSEDLDAGAQEVQYLYIDDSVLVADATNVITNARILNSAEAPSWDDAQYGWYPSANGTYVQTTDRCIGAVLINASNQVASFRHDGGNLFQYDLQITDRAKADLDTTWTDVTLSIPTFCTSAQVTFEGEMASPSLWAGGYYRANGSSSNGHLVLKLYAGAENTLQVYTDSSQKIEVRFDRSATDAMGVYTDGFYLPAGM